MPIFRLLLLFLQIVPFSLQGTAQRRQPAPTDHFTAQLTAELTHLHKAALESGYAYAQLAHLTENIGPRLSGSAQAGAAVQYVADELKRLGLEVRLEPVSVPHWVRGLETGEIVQFAGQASGTTQKIVLTALGGSVATPPEGITADVVAVDDFEQLNRLGRQGVAGKIVLFNVKFDKQMTAQGYGLEAYEQAVVYRGAGPSEAARLGAVACLVRSIGSADYRLPHTGATSYSDDTPKIPAAAVTAEDADLIAHLVAQGPARIHLTLTPQTLANAPSYNVVADLKGSESPDQIVVVSGHLDSWDLGTGAIDDGAGVAVAMGAAQLIRNLDLHPKRTIRVIAWMNEENGLAGGRAYAADHSSEIKNHIAAIESDLGAGHPTGFSAHIDPAGLQALQPLAQILKSSGAALIRLADGPVGADISPLDAAGVPGFAPLQDSRTYFHYHHTAADTLDKVSPRELSENSALMAVLAYTLANLPDPPRLKPAPLAGH
jgi:carboxypeptidase Q